MGPEKVQIFIDVTCPENPGPGGWAAIIINGECQRVLQGKETSITNNQLYLIAAIKVLEDLPEHTIVTIISVSDYLIKGMNKDIHFWINNGWRKTNGKPVKNMELWFELNELNGKHNVTWEVPVGGSHHRERGLCKRLAIEALNRRNTETVRRGKCQDLLSPSLLNENNGNRPFSVAPQPSLVPIAVNQ